MPAPKPDLRLNLDRARQVFLAAQGFPARAESSERILEETGFVRTLGGVDVYIAVRARRPGMRRADLDEAVEERAAQVVPSVRGCMYLVPRRDVPLALRAADLLSRGRAEKDQQKAGILPGEVEVVAKAVIQVLAEKGPLTTDALRRAMPAGSVRSLGELGKKVGISSPLPPALRRLEFEGRVERKVESGRLDSERYLWRATARSPFDGAGLPDDPIEIYARLARIFFHCAGLGTQKDFAAWAGIAQRDAKAAIEKTPVLPVAIEGVDDAHYLLEDRRDLLEKAEEASQAVALLPFEDNVLALHGGPFLMVDPQHHATPVPSWGSSKESTLGDSRHMAMRSVAAEGRVVGFWEYDPDPREVVVGYFEPIPKEARARIEAEAADLTRFLNEDLGHGRSFSLDTDDDLRQRSGFVRKM
ncbi:MAG TPA: crosslink repair DNA glycosylase YcaQ family protein [Thermoanaerobaculia bacterium]